MAGNGGYQRPANPAPTSGVGANSARTDGNPSMESVEKAAMYLSGAPYGEAAELNQQNRVAQQIVNQEGAGGGSPAPAPTPRVPAFGSKSERPWEPVTTGNPLGPGAGPTQPIETPEQVQDREALATWYTLLKMAADKSGTSDATRQLVRRLGGEL